jgi:hypothetical protein
LVASRIADVATARTSSIPVARQKWAYSSTVSSARSIGSGASTPVVSRPSPIRTGSWISSVRFHHWSGTQVNSTSRNEFDPRSMTASRFSVPVMASAEASDGTDGLTR